MARSATTTAAGINPKFKEETSLNTVYILNGENTPVSLEIIIGAACQTSTTDITIDNAILVQGVAGSIAELEIGKNKDLNGKTVYITTVVTDTAEQTNYTEALIRIRGGAGFKEYHLFKTVPQQGDSAIFIAIIELFKI